MHARACTSPLAILRCTCQQPTLVRCFLLCVRGSSSGLCVRFNRGCLFCGLRHRSSEGGNINFLWAGNRVVSLLYCVGRGEGSEEGCSSRLEAWLSRINLQRGREPRLKQWTWLWHGVRVGNIQNCMTYLLSVHWNCISGQSSYIISVVIGWYYQSLWNIPPPQTHAPSLSMGRSEMRSGMNKLYI